MRLFTFGHSTRSQQEIIACLQGHGVTLLADVRSLPGSRRYPWVDREAIGVWLPEHGIRYELQADLGGRRRKQDVDPVVNGAWRNRSFHNFADYTLSDRYETGLAHLLGLAERETVAIMCSEAVPWRCHRSLISSTLVARGHEVWHIMDAQHATRHSLGRYGPEPRVEEGTVTYPAPEDEPG